MSWFQVVEQVLPSEAQAVKKVHILTSTKSADQAA